MKKSTLTSHQRIAMLVVMAMLAALQVVLSRFLSINTQITKIGFAFVPISVCAMLFGPLPTVIVAVVADVVGAFLFPSGPFFPGFTLSAALNAMVYGLLLYKKQTVLRVILAVAINQFVLSLFVTPLWLSLMYGMPYWATVIHRLYQIALLTAVEIVVNIALTRIIPTLKKSLPILAARPVMAVAGEGSPAAIINGKPVTDLSEDTERR